MDFIEWKEDYSVGVPSIDAQHKKLVELINKLNHAVLVKSSGHTLKEILKQLIDYTVVHFTYEEKLMKENDYQQLAPHLVIHKNLTDQVKEYYQRIEDGNTSFSLELLGFLRSWLINHILKEDMKYKDFFSSKNVK